MLSVFMCFFRSLSSLLITMLIVDKHCCDVCCDEFLVPQIDRILNKQKNIDMEKYICNQYGEN